MVCADFPDDAIERIAHMPADPPVTGSKWPLAELGLALDLPSDIVPPLLSLVINPDQPAEAFGGSWSCSLLAGVDDRNK
ncbi:MAG: hypothetical protein FKY71_19460, partial [Spiribacter salinus]